MCFRLLYTLRHCGFIEKADGNRYRLTSEVRRRKRYRIGYASQGQNSSFGEEVQRGLVRAAERERLELIVVDNRYQPKIALKNAELLIRDSVDLVIEFQTDEAMAPAIAARYHEAKIPLIAIDIPHPGATYFGANNYEAGLLAGRYLGKWARQIWNGQADEILLVELARAGSLPASRIRGAVAGIREVIREAADWPVVSIDGDGQFKTALERVRKHFGHRARGRFWWRRPTIRARSARRVPSKRPGERGTAPLPARTRSRMPGLSFAGRARRWWPRSGTFPRNTATD